MLGSGIDFVEKAKLEAQKLQHEMSSILSQLSI